MAALGINAIALDRFFSVKCNLTAKKFQATISRLLTGIRQLFIGVNDIGKKALSSMILSFCNYV